MNSPLKKVAAASILTPLLGLLPVIAFLDNRHALASDFDLFQAQYASEFGSYVTDSYEEKVEEIEDKIQILEGLATRTPQDDQRLRQLKDRKEKYLRKLDRMNGGKHG